MRRPPSPQPELPSSFRAVTYHLSEINTSRQWLRETEGWPINLPSQRLENRGLDPSVEIVPRGTFSWGTGRSPPTSSSSWGTVGLSSSPPVGSGAWNTASMSTSSPSSNNNSGSQNPSRPLSAGSARPSSAGNARPLSASTASGRAWGGAAKLEEQLQPSRFNLTTAEFPTLGSDKNLNLRPQQTAASNRPTSADAMKERHLACADHYQSGSLVDRPTSADGTKERKPVYTDWPTSADGMHTDKGRQKPALLFTHPPFPDGTLPDQRQPVYTGVVGHGTAGPGPGTLDRPVENFSGPPIPVQHGIAAQGREFAFPGAPQHDLYYNRPGGPHGNDVVVVPMDARPEVYGSYAFDSRPNHPDISRVHHPRPSWGPNHLDRSGIPQGPFLQSGPSEHFHIMRPPPRRMETAVLHEQVAGNRRDGFGIGDKAFGEQRGGWSGANVVYIGSAMDARESSIPMTGSGQEFPRPDMFRPPWGHQPMHAGWGNNMYGADRTMGMYQDMPSSVMRQQTKSIETPQGSVSESASDIPESTEKGPVRIDEVVHSSSLGGRQAAALGNTHMVGLDMQYLKQEETIKTSSVKILAGSPDTVRNKNNMQVSQGPLVGNQPSKGKQEDEGTKAEQKREPKKMSLMSDMTSQRQENNCHGNLQGFHLDRFVPKDNNGLGDDVKGSSKKKTMNLQQSIKGMEETDSSHEREERMSLLKASDGNLINCNNWSSAALSATSDKDVLKDACTDSFSKTAENIQLEGATKDFKVPSMENSVSPLSSEQEKAPLDEGLKPKRNGHSVRRAHGRSIQESHSVDRQHVNHGMVWAPKPTAVGATKEEVQPALEHENKGESQVQLMQSAASSQQGQEQQVQEQSVVSSKRSAQHVQHQKGERISKKQGHRMQQQQQARSNIFEQSAQDEQSISCKNQSLHTKHQQLVTSSRVESEPLGGQAIAIDEREAQVKQLFPFEEAEKAGEVIGTPVLEKSDGKKPNSAYVRKPARNQHRQQQREQEYEGVKVNNHHGQRFYSKDEKSVAEDLENPAAMTSAPYATESKKNQREVKSRSLRISKQHKVELHESAASLASGEGSVLSGDRSQVEVRAETSVPYFAVEAKVVKDKEERPHNQKLGRQQETHVKQSAMGEHRHFGQELKADTISCESSTNRTEKKLYVPKQARKLNLQQESEATGPQGQMIQEVHSSNEKGQYEGQWSPPSGTPVRKNDMERYTPLPARQPYMQGQQSAARGQRGQRTADLTGAQAIQAASGHGGSEPAQITDSAGKGDESQPRAMGHSMGRAPPTGDSAHGHRGQRIADRTGAQAIRASSDHVGSESAHRTDLTGKGDESQPRAMGHSESSESIQSKKEVKHYIVKSGGQQQWNADEEAPVREEKWQRSHRTSATESSRRKEGMKLYTPKPARQEETSVTSDAKVAEEVLSLQEHLDLVRNEKEERTQGSDQSYKNRSFSTKAFKYASVHRSSKRNMPQLEDRNDTQPTQEDSVHALRVNGSIKDHKKDQEYPFPQKLGSLPGNGDLTAENSSFENAEVAKPRQYQRRHYHYQPVAQQQQTVKPQAEESNAQRPNNKQVDQGHQRKMMMDLAILYNAIKMDTFPRQFLVNTQVSEVTWREILPSIIYSIVFVAQCKSKQSWPVLNVFLDSVCERRREWCFNLIRAAFSVGCVSKQLLVVALWAVLFIALPFGMKGGVYAEGVSACVHRITLQIFKEFVWMPPKVNHLAILC
ncbi:hypothetical protein GOP47_0000436 [Adiantum capillus-veneris]|uniref:Uncharacterized protein n=1 Tax=Adiantum capillus-veneris TaxID=13818 RepID=A0A9D4VF54_ADICA|nr:hypothetical protein GOP47_0000436 [Adiantum capillus-veneris]